MESESSKTSGIELTPFFERATHKYCLMAVINISFDLNTGPAFCRIESNSWRDRIFERSSCDFGSGVPSGKGFMESLQRALKTRKASFCRTWLNFAITAVSFSLCVSTLSCEGNL